MVKSGSPLNFTSPQELRAASSRELGTICSEKRSERTEPSCAEAFLEVAPYRGIAHCRAGMKARLPSQPPEGMSDACIEAARLDRVGQHLEAIAVLSRGAAAGDLLAKRTVGLRILLGDRAPSLGSEGARLLLEAAAEGDARAAELSAIIFGAGVHCTQNWDVALQWLQRAAELGSVRSRGALAALCADRDQAAQASQADPPGELWNALCEHIDLGRMLAPPLVQTLHREPVIGLVAEMAEPWLCDWLISQARGRLAPAEVYNPYTKSRQTTPDRTNSSAIMGILDTDLAQIVLQSRIAAAIRVPFANLEPAFVLHYAPGQTFHDHYDFVDPDTPNYEDEIARNGQRVMTFLIYLNGEYEGGETDFPRLGISHRGAAGQGFFFENVRADGKADTTTLHAGRPPTRGEKWVLSQFIRNRAMVPGNSNS